MEDRKRRAGNTDKEESRMKNELEKNKAGKLKKSERERPRNEASDGKLDRVCRPIKGSIPISNLLKNIPKKEG